MDVGQLLGGRYQLVDRLGEGGMSVVWRANDVVLGREVAVKVMGSPGPETIVGGAILAEAKAAARVSHPNVASVFDYGDMADESGERVPFIVMEVLRGTTLAELAATASMTPVSTLRVCAQVAGALAAAHAQGLVHRDVKPGNIMVTTAGAKVFDFGIALPVGTMDDPGPDEPILGTPAYLAPERLTGGAVSPASDVYSLGVLIYRLLTGQLPWPATTAAEIMTAHVFAEPAHLPPVAGVPPEVGELYQQCMAKAPGERPSARRAATVLAAAAGIPPPTGEGIGDGPDAITGTIPVAGIPSEQTIASAAAAATGLRPGGAPEDIPNRRGLRGRSRKLVIAGVGAACAGLLAWVLMGSGTNLAPTVSGPVPTGTASPVAFTTVDPVPRPSGGLAPQNSGVAAGTGSLPMPDGGPGPAGPTGLASTNSPPPDPPTTRTSVRPPGQTFTSAGGMIVAECNSSDAQLVSWSPASGFQVKSANPGPATQVAATFKMKGTEITMTVRCTSGNPTMVTSQKP